MIKRVRELIEHDHKHDLYGYGGTGAPGTKLEDLILSKPPVGINLNAADWGGIEIKYSSWKSKLLSLFHSDPPPAGVTNGTGMMALKPMLRAFGKLDKKGRLALRHTISGSSRLEAVRDGGVIVVRERHVEGLPKPTTPEMHWDIEGLIMSASKLRHTIFVNGRVKEHKSVGKREVFYESAALYRGFKPLVFINAIINGGVVIDFDCREKEPGSETLRSHGTKFRLRQEVIPKLWVSIEPIFSR